MYNMTPARSSNSNSNSEEPDQARPQRLPQAQPQPQPQPQPQAQPWSGSGKPQPVSDSTLRTHSCTSHTPPPPPPLVKAVVPGSVPPKPPSQSQCFRTLGSSLNPNPNQSQVDLLSKSKRSSSFETTRTRSKNHYITHSNSISFSNHSNSHSAQLWPSSSHLNRPSSLVHRPNFLKRSHPPISISISNPSPFPSRSCHPFHHHSSIHSSSSLPLIPSFNSHSISSIGFLVNSATSLSHSSLATPSTMNFANSINKPVIRHITSSSTLASLSNHSSSSTILSLSKQDSNFGLILSNSSSPSPNQDLAPTSSGLSLRPGDVWSQVVLRVVPLFNGKGHKGFIEDLNEFVSQHIHKTIADSPSKSIAKLHADLTELFGSGVQTLNHKLQPEMLSDDRLLVRLVEVWHFFFTGVLPYLEAIFLPLVTDSNLQSMIESKNNKVLQERLQQQHLLQQATSNTALLSSSSNSILFRQSQRNPNCHSRHHPSASQPSRPDEPIQGIDIRRLALTAFRDLLVLPLFPRLYTLYARLYDPLQAAKLQHLSPDCHSEQMHAKRLQMVGLLCSVHSDDPKQSTMEEFGKLIRLGKANAELLKMPPAPGNVRSGPSRSLSSLRDNDLGRGVGVGVGIGIGGQVVEEEPVRGAGGQVVEDDDERGVGMARDGQQQQIRGWNKNRDFARRSIRRQLGRNGTRGGGQAGGERSRGEEWVARGAGQEEEQIQELLREQRGTPSSGPGSGSGSRGGGGTKMGSVSSTGSSISTSMMMAMFRGSRSAHGTAGGPEEGAAAEEGPAGEGGGESLGGPPGSSESLKKHVSPQRQLYSRDREQQDVHDGKSSGPSKTEGQPSLNSRGNGQGGGIGQSTGQTQQPKLNLQIRPVQYSSNHSNLPPPHSLTHAPNQQKHGIVGGTKSSNKKIEKDSSGTGGTGGCERSNGSIGSLVL